LFAHDQTMACCWSTQWRSISLAPLSDCACPAPAAAAGDWRQHGRRWGTCLSRLRLQRRCAKCSGTWHGKRDGRAVVEHDTQRRGVVLHTMFGAARARVLDWNCPDDAENIYDGLDDGVFAVTSTSVILRDVLDSLVFATCSGITQLAAYAVFKSQQQSAELRFLVDQPLGSYWLPDRALGRRAVSTALALYLPHLESAVGGSIDHLFTCDECQYVDSDGRTRWRGVAFDETATGVRGDLRSQVNETALMRALPARYRPEQFLLRANSDRAAAVCFGRALQAATSNDDEAVCAERRVDIGAVLKRRYSRNSQRLAVLQRIQTFLAPAVEEMDCYNKDFD
jgi:hypothetical protein